MSRVLDLGPGDGRLVRLLKIDRPNIEAVALDVSPTILKAAQDHFANDTTVKVIEHDFNFLLPESLGYFDAA
jgi:ubiquinone/menaquinone biosynthesis C-methylase UbiE